MWRRTGHPRPGRALHLPRPPSMALDRPLFPRLQGLSFSDSIARPACRLACPSRRVGLGLRIALTFMLGMPCDGGGWLRDGDTRASIAEGERRRRVIFA